MAGNECEVYEWIFPIKTEVNNWHMAAYKGLKGFDTELLLAKKLKKGLIVTEFKQVSPTQI